MATVLGLDGFLYRNTGVYGTPVWDEITNVRDVVLTLEKDEADVTSRASNGWRLLKGSLKNAAIEHQSVWDTEDTDFAALLAAFLDNEPIDMLCLDGPAATVGSEGLRADMEVFKCTRNEALSEAMMSDIAMKPTRSANAPAWWVTEA